MWASLPWNKTILADDSANVVVSVPLGDADNRRRALPRRARRAHGGHLVVALVAEPRDAEARADAEDADAVLAELPAPVEHEHAQRRLGAAVADRLKGHRLGPAGGHGARGEEVLGRGQRQLREARDEEDARVGRGQKQRHKVPGHDVRARHVGVVGPGEGGAEGELAVGGVPVVRGA